MEDPWREMYTIAVIDDDIFIGDMLEKALSKEGYQVIRAYSGTEALLLLERRRPDLILLDLMLPGLSGEQVIEKISDIPVIVVSARTSVDDKVTLLTGGAVAISISCPKTSIFPTGRCPNRASRVTANPTTGRSTTST